MGIIEDLFNIFAPHECLMCKAEGALLCRTCTEGLSSVPPRCYLCKRWSEGFRTCERCRRHSALFEVRAATEYGGATKELLRRLKFARARAAADTIAQSLARLHLDGEVLITHIPTANVRVRQRGYDQAALIARAVSKRLKQPHLSLLVRQNDQRQVGQSRTMRYQQTEEAFRIQGSPTLDAKHVLVIDDVLTTGATCEAAARVLRQAGARRVSAMVFAVA